MNEAKIVIIYGINKVDGKDRNGEIECLGQISSDDLHISCFCEFFENNFLDDPVFKKVTYTTIPETIGYLLTERNHIVFLNTTTIKNGKNYGNKGFFMMPSTISDSQKRMVYELIDDLKDFNINIFYDFVVTDYIDSKIMSTNSSCSPKKLIDKFFQNDEFVKNK